MHGDCLQTEREKPNARNREMTDDKPTMHSSTSLTSEPSSKLRHPSALVLAGAFCFFLFVWSDMLMGQLMDWQSGPARGTGAAGFILF